ncbi:hypothetical protein GlitD10_1263 [Gloeomargarita lithophora Alchichica-D10]|uniref:Uncharacterized protein n=1 Tax=Gloeomargarita lithophora Alchichica-D10 TaxID=1188229 RepID=A0A1J0ACC8_9CYAN|nr:hypothetical protein [Gloeomargarita lithophora]APB33583.1 hypothetical protein GlitD10_1263 [Gloeomargarita lithophora Alchichica-D10]
MTTKISFAPTDEEYQRLTELKSEVGGSWNEVLSFLLTKLGDPLAQPTHSGLAALAQELNLPPAQVIDLLVSSYRQSQSDKGSPAGNTSELTLDVLKLSTSDRAILEKLIFNSGKPFLELVKYGLMLQIRPDESPSPHILTVEQAFDLLAGFNDQTAEINHKIYIDIAVLEMQAQCERRTAQDWYVANLERVKTHHKKHGLSEVNNRLRMRTVGHGFHGVEWVDGIYRERNI